jgi:hypothetical protein
MTADLLLSFDEFSNIINGELRKTKETRYSINPSTLEHNPPVPVSSSNDVDEAVVHGRNAFKTWSKIPLSARQDAVIALAAGLQSLKSDFARLLVREQGKPVSGPFCLYGQAKTGIEDFPIANYLGISSGLPKTKSMPPVTG